MDIHTTRVPHLIGSAHNNLLLQLKKKNFKITSAAIDLILYFVLIYIN